MAEHNRLTKAARPYRLRARAAAMDRTRERITHAAVELHGTIGPAATTMSAVAELAGVTRATLYRHFPNEEALFTACSTDWLAANPRIQVHYTATSGSWLNLVEVWFGIIERQAIRRGTFGSVKDLNAKIRAFIDGWNNRCHPFVWTKTADEILKKANRPTTSETRH